MKKILFAALAAFVLVLSGCDNLVDESDQGSAYINLSEGSSGRYIAGDGETVVDAAMGFVKEDVLYNFDFLEDIKNFSGDYLFTGIPVGDYSFLALLMDDDGEVLSMAVESVTIEAGFNELEIEMGPGISPRINGKDFDFSDPEDSGFSISFSGEVITIGVPEEELKTDFLLEITTNAKDMEIVKFNNSELSGIEAVYTATTDELDYATGEYYFDATEINELRLNLTSFDDSETSIKIKLIAL
ncbi:hypothetical protein EXM22_03010 [Oceanispirochaeta crateris]|uniref:DUF4382 domain-containing protein n=1 Tax=Oceanispirochaeta crateris TaxID=2518645 RepID=A0A5C1QK84_9SPIO|nr:membrane lipoprotein lipid attachment site-containing protein [Oceanispirochaeta crateris]QEN07004.1 hypothetical protein EXM22_03010 [Oceanispirochaeta crateris]